MKPLYILLVALFISQSYCDDEEDYTKDCGVLSETTGLEDCNSREDSDDSTDHCCLADYKLAGKKLKGCVSLSKEAYDDIDETIDNLKNQFELEELDIDCSSYYIILSLLSLILLLL